MIHEKCIGYADTEMLKPFTRERQYAIFLKSTRKHSFISLLITNNFIPYYFKMLLKIFEPHSAQGGLSAMKVKIKHQSSINVNFYNIH